MFRKILLSQNYFKNVSIYRGISEILESRPREPLKVAVCGAAGRMGRSLSLFLHLSRAFDQIALYDVTRDCGAVGLDISYLNLECDVQSYSGRELLKESLKGANILLCTAALATPSSLTPTEMFPYNAKIVEEICEAAADVCPQAVVVICTGPVNSMVPLACEVMKRKGHYDPKKVIGMTSLDVVRCSAIAGRIQGSEPTPSIALPVVGGSSSNTLVPVLSQSQPSTSFKEDEVEALTEALRNSEAEIGSYGGSAPMSAAYAAASFTIALCRALRGEEGIQECCFVAAERWLGLGYIAAPVQLGREGVEEVIELPLNPYEQHLLEKAKVCLKEDITRGTTFARKNGTGMALCCG